MQSVDLVVKGGRVFTSGSLQRADVLVRGERIVAITSGDVELPLATETIDASGKIVLPGVIDTHVHFRDPGFTHKEDFETGTRASAAGGVTLAVDMPNTKPSTNTAERYAEHKQDASKKACIDFNHWPGPPNHNLDEIADMMAQGAIGVKVFMMKDTKRSYPHMPELGITDEGHLLEIFKACKRHNATLAVHPHNQAICDNNERKYFWEKGLNGPEHYAKSLRYDNNVMYDTAFATLLLMARVTGTHLHLLHLNTTLSIQMVKWATANGAKVSTEVNPAHMFVTMDHILKQGPWVLGKWTPPEDREAIWQALCARPFDILIGTDHAPHAKEEKEIGWQDMWKAAGGAPYVQFYLSLFLNEINKGAIALERVVDLCSETPARVFGFYPRKGVIRVGSDADMVICDMEKVHTITQEEVLSKCGWTPFAGWTVKGFPVATIVRGTQVMKDGKILVKPGFGKFIPIARETA